MKKREGFKDIWLVKCYRRAGRWWMVYRYRNGRRFKLSYKEE